MGRAGARLPRRPRRDARPAGAAVLERGWRLLQLRRAPVDNLSRLETLIDHWRQRPDVNPTRVYLIGFSNGGFMAHRLACWMDDRLAAVVSLAGAGRGPRRRAA